MIEGLQENMSECRHGAELPVESFTPWGKQGVLLRALRRLADGSLRSALIEIPAGWQGVIGSGVAPLVQIFLLSGSLDLGTRVLSGYGFTVLGANHQMPAVSPDGCTVIAIFDAPRQEGADSRRAVLEIIDDVFAIEPFTPTIKGKLLAGFERRVLWLDPVTGGDTRLLRVPGGFAGGGPNWHPVEEEIFCLEGDIQPDDSRPMRAGSFLWNPAYSIHGYAERSDGGCLLLEWHDGPWSMSLMQ